MAKTFRKAPYSEFEDAMKKTGHSAGALCKILGYSEGAYTGWMKENSIPPVASIALKSVVSDHLKVAMIYVPAGDVDTIRKIVIGCGGVFRSVRI